MLEHDHVGPCPWCTTQLERRSPDGVAPRAGDSCVCYVCGGMIYFDEHTRMQRLTGDKLAAWPERTRRQLAELSYKITALHKYKGREN